MRMWMVPVNLLCRKHLLGEHGEIHKFRHNFVKKHNMIKRIGLNQIEPYSMKVRHDELAAEMIRRGYNHNSEYEQPDVSYLPKTKVDIVLSSQDLFSRCKECGRKNG